MLQNQIFLNGITVSDVANEFIKIFEPTLSKKIQELATTPKGNKKRYLSRSETCELLKINITTLWRWQKKGILTAYAIENRVLFDEDEVLAVIEKNRV